jgi:uridine kinase
MTISPGEGNHFTYNTNTLEIYLERGNYECLDEIHSSYYTICEAIAPIEASIVIAIDGPTNGGKTSLANTLVDFYTHHNIPVSLLSLDHFLTDRKTRTAITQSMAEDHFDIADYSHAAWEQDNYRASIALAKQLTMRPTPQTLTISNSYDRLTGAKERNESIPMFPGGIIITEGVGIHTYHSDLFDVKIRVDTRESETLVRRLLQRERQKPADTLRLDEEFLLHRHNLIDAPHTAFLRDTSPNADFVVDASNFEAMLVHKQL